VAARDGSIVMIYFDNSATTLMKPPEVAEAVKYAINNFGNTGRSFYDAALTADRELYRTRAEIAKLVGLDEPLNVAFTSSFTESQNLVAGGLIEKNDAVVTTVTEHNSVLRPLYLSGCNLRFIDCDDDGVLRDDSIREAIKPPVKYLFCTHGSNLTGNITDARTLYGLCKENGVTMVLDVSQTLGTVPVDIDMADVFCFSGHKGLFGPQGTGGVIVNGRFDFRLVKTGGSGSHSFDRFQPLDMPDVFESGTPNGHGIYGLQKGVIFVNETGVDRIHARTDELWKAFYNGVKDSPGVRVYGGFSTAGALSGRAPFAGAPSAGKPSIDEPFPDRLPVISINITGLSSTDFAQRLWDDYGIATRPGIHCAPLLHKRLGTAGAGMVRFSFSYFNTDDEIAAGVRAVNEIARHVNEYGIYNHIQ